MTTLSRRQFLRASTLTAAATFAAACAVPPAAPQQVGLPAGEATAEPTTAPPATAVGPSTEGPAVPPARYSEAPMLAELVARGELPPVEERLPENPLVCSVVESVGVYGGTARSVFKGMGDLSAVRGWIEHGPLTFTPEITVLPNTLESWETNEDGSVWTFRMRKGMKWSDGHPLTSADVQWYWDHVVKNSDLTAVTPSRWSVESGGVRTLAEIDVPDDYTFVLSFVRPKVMFAYDMTWLAQPWVPAHYMQQFHAEFAPAEKLDQMVQEGGLNSWTALYADRDKWWLNPERPCLNSWLAKNDPTGDLLITERNPYFHQVDSEGQQLPYLDRVTFRLYQMHDVFIMWMLSGEVDFPAYANAFSITDYPVFKEREAEGNYEFLPGHQLAPNHSGFQFNLAPKDMRLRGLFQDRRFRIAVSLAMNRDEINEIVYDGLSTPRQYSPLETSPQYYPKLSNAYIEYNPDEANRLLDEIGITERDSEGFRRWNDGSGETISFTAEGIRPPGHPEEDVLQMAVSYLHDVGLKATYKYTERSLYEERVAANLTEVTAWGCDRSLLPVYNHYNFTGEQMQRNWAGAWGLWKNNPNDPNAEEPPEGHWIREIWRIYWDEVLAEPDEQERFRLFEKIMDIHAEELPMVHLLGQEKLFPMKPARMHNVSPGRRLTWEIGYMYTLQAHQYYWEDPENHV